MKPCFRKYHFAQHFRNIHPGLNADDYEETSVVCSETEFPRKCGFCKHHFESRQERIDHIAEHFKQGKCMLDWNDSDDSADSNDANDDDDDKPSDDGSKGSRPADQPPPRHPRAGHNSNYFGGGSDRTGGGSSGGESQSGFFQFQLSQLNDGQSGSQSSRANQLIKPKSALRSTQQRTRCTSEPLPEQPTEQPSSAGQWYTQGNFNAPKGDDSHPLARDGLTKSLVQHQRDTELAEDHHLTKALIPDVKTDWLDSLLQARQRMTISGATSASSSGGATRSLAADEHDLAIRTSIETSSGATRHETEVARVSQALQNIPPASQPFLSVRLLGSGGFSTVDEVVHRATSLRLSRKTLKNRNPAAIKELLKEVNMLQKLRHPHVIRFLGAYTTGDKMSILLSPIADTTLALWLDRYKQDQPANLSQVVSKMFGCLAASVRYLHEQRPVVKHMDIKPQNILIVEGDGEFPHVVLCDFGISTSEEITEGSLQPLTRHYVAPEAFEGFTRKQAADIWSLGCVFAEMASVSFNQGNSSWSELRKEYSGRATKYYWQDVAGLQDRLTSVHEGATTSTEKTVVRTLKAMLKAQPEERPDAATLAMVFTPASCCLSWPNKNAAYPGPHEEASLVEMLGHEDGTICHGELTQHGHSAAGSQQALSTAKSWIERCSHSHEECAHPAPNGANTLPSRLVDISPDGKAGRSVRVVDSTSMESRVEYVALSHIWSQSDVTLSAADLQTSHVDIPLSSLSQAMNEAITTAQGLAYRYLWIDSLCIQQDSDNDKRQGCASMAATFRNAALTLILDNVDQTTTDVTNAIATHSNNCIDRTGPDFGLDTRAWALQERLLSHRLLHMGQEQLYFECNSLKASETFPQGLPSLIWEKAHTKVNGTHHNVPKIDNSLATHDRLTQLHYGTKLPGLTELKQASKDQFAAHSRQASGSQSNNLVRTPQKFKQANRLEQRRVRDCQWIKKEGNSIGDNMEAAQMKIQARSASTLDPLRLSRPQDKQAPLSSRTHGPSTFGVEDCREGVFHGEEEGRNLLRASEQQLTNDTDGRSHDSAATKRCTVDAFKDDDRTNANEACKDVCGHATISSSSKTHDNARNNDNVAIKKTTPNDDRGSTTSSSTNHSHGSARDAAPATARRTLTTDSEDDRVSHPSLLQCVSSKGLRLTAARKEISMSGQLDQNGSMSSRNTNGSSRSRSRNGSKRNGKANGRTNMGGGNGNEKADEGDARMHGGGEEKDGDVDVVMG